LRQVLFLYFYLHQLQKIITQKE